MKLKKGLLTTLSLSLAFLSIGPSISYAEDSNAKDEQTYDINLHKDGIVIDDKFYTPEEFEKHLEDVQIVDKTEENEGDNTDKQLAFVPAVAAGTYFVPGVGEVAIAASGAIVVGGITIKAGSALYDKIKDFFSDSQKVVSSKYNIPKSLLDSDGKVKLGGFKDKNGRTPLNKSGGSFKKGNWSVDKDKSNHGGRKWKLKNNGKRKASLDENGKVLSD